MRTRRHDEIKGKPAAFPRLPLLTWSRWFWTVIGGAAILTFFMFWRQAEIQLTKKEIELTSAQEALASIRQQVKMVQNENQAWKQKVPVLDAFGPEVTEFRVWPLRRG